MSRPTMAFATTLGIAFAAALAIAATQPAPHRDAHPAVPQHPIAPPVDLNPCAAGACW